MSNYIYNNEAIAVTTLIEVLKNMGKIENTKFLLIFPLLSNDKLMSFLRRGTIRSLEELLVKRGNLLSGFNNTYKELLPITINSIVILNEMKLIKHENGSIIYIGKKDLKIEDIDSKRFIQIQKNVEKIVCILNESTEKLYLQLKVIL